MTGAVEILKNEFRRIHDEAVEALHKVVDAYAAALKAKLAVYENAMSAVDLPVGVADLIARGGAFRMGEFVIEASTPHWVSSSDKGKTIEVKAGFDTVIGKERNDPLTIVEPGRWRVTIIVDRAPPAMKDIVGEK